MLKTEDLLMELNIEIKPHQRLVLYLFGAQVRKWAGVDAAWEPENGNDMPRKPTAPTPMVR